MIKTNGHTFLKFYEDKAWWPEEAWHEDDLTVINGILMDHLEIPVPANAVVEIEGGIMHGIPNEGISFEDYFKQWLEIQNSVSILVTCNPAQLELIRDLVTRAGGRVS